MKTIVGLFQAKAHALNSLDELTKFGISRDQIRVLACDASSQTRLREGRNRIVGQYAGRGVLLGIAVAGTFGLAIGLSGLPAAGFGLRFFVIALIVFSGIGAALGGVLGALFGLDGVERVTALCDEGLALEGVLEIVETSNELAPRVTASLQQSRAVAVEIYPELEAG